jgi:hypothetical protein
LLSATSKETNPLISLKLRQKIKKQKQNMLVYLSNSRNATYKIISNTDAETQTYVSQIKGNSPEMQREVLNISQES